jgi:hypothetical protein
MRKIKIESWKAIVSDIEGKPVIDETTKQPKTQDESLLSALNVLLMGRNPQDMLRGYQNFTTYMHVMGALSKAESTGILELEDADYEFLKKMIETDIPAQWAGSPNIAKSITTFMDAKKEP